MPSQGLFRENEYQTDCSFAHEASVPACGFISEYNVKVLPAPKIYITATSTAIHSCFFENRNSFVWKRFIIFHMTQCVFQIQKTAPSELHDDSPSSLDRDACRLLAGDGGQSGASGWQRSGQLPDNDSRRHSLLRRDAGRRELQYQGEDLHLHKREATHSHSIRPASSHQNSATRS